LSAIELLVDACVLINLYGSGRFEAIAQSSGFDLLVAEEAAAEGLYVEREGVLERIDLVRLRDVGVIRIVGLTKPEVATMVDFASEIDEGEAATLAIATHRQIAVATDDRGALRFINRRNLKVTVLRTSDLVRKWAEVDVTADEIRMVLHLIESDARFRPGPADPNQDWWEQSIDD
jgi:predicted nucleic acid-binding protein